MMRILFFICLAAPAWSETLVASRTLPAQTVITSSDFVVQTIDVPGAVSDPNQLIGMETRVAVYAGRPIRPGDVGLPAIVERNEIVTMIYDAGGIVVTTEGRALDRAGPGDVIRIMNLSSRNIVTARIGADRNAHVTR